MKIRLFTVLTLIVAAVIISGFKPRAAADVSLLPDSEASRPVDIRTLVVSGGLTFESLSAGAEHTCGITTDGDAYCWGRNLYGQLGNGTTSGTNNVPVAVSGAHTFESLSAGNYHTCGVTDGETVLCWGYNPYGQLGIGTNTDTNEPAAVWGGHTFESVSAGAYHTCGITTDGDAYCWGYNGLGQLGNGTNTDTNEPVAVPGGHTFESVSAGSGDSCGVTTAGAAYCWGYNFYGQLGIGTWANANEPAAVSGGHTFESVSAGFFHSCGVADNGTAFCWGYNRLGQLGNGTLTNSNVPVEVLGGTIDDEGPVTINTTATPNPVAVGSNIDLTANVDDVNTGGSNIASAEYSLDGGSTWSLMSAADLAFDAVGEDVGANFNAPAEAGIYGLCVRGTDDPGNLGADECILLVVYDPTGGFVTGGGWINSPAGAYTEDPSLSGKAKFGFVSKYKKGATVPTGQTEFRFKAGDLDFHSTSYDWLVIAGAKAMYKGVGTINGVGSFDFQISAIDGQVNGGGGVDKFRIKIKGDTGVVYDNQSGAGDNADPTTAIGGGSITVHKSGGKGAGKTGDSVTEDAAATLPQEFALDQNYPNPFNPTTTIRFDVPEASRVTLVVFDMLGRRVANLVDGVVAAGSHAASFDARSLPSGSYIYRLETPDGTFTKAMLLLK